MVKQQYRSTYMTTLGNSQSSSLEIWLPSPSVNGRVRGGSRIITLAPSPSSAAAVIVALRVLFAARGTLLPGFCRSSSSQIPGSTTLSSADSELQNPAGDEVD